MIFQGRDGPALRDNLVELVRKKPGTSVDLQGPELLGSTEQTMQPCLAVETISCHRNSGILIDDESQILLKSDQIQKLRPTLRD